MAVRLSDAELGERLHRRRFDTLSVSLKPAPGAAFNQCHENAEAYAHTHEDCWVVRGLLIEDFSDFSYFNAHSLVRGPDGELFDPTPMRQQCLFLVHEGDEENFALQRLNRPRVQYPPLDLGWETLAARAEREDDFHDY
jgi:hypothetical protein